VNHSFDILQKVRRTISLHHMLEPGDKVVVAVSGGADSVCLLDILERLSPELRLQLIVAHLDHGLRPQEDEIETRFVEQLAAQKGAAFETEKAMLLKNLPGVSLEETAREVRYAFLERVKNKHQAQKIALGHQLNDQAETVLMRLLRGSGAKGLSGIPPRRGALIRPLLELETEEIRAYLRERGREFMTDSSNLAPHYLRNKIRLDLLPRLLEYQPRLVKRLGHLSALFQAENSYLEEQAENWIQGHAALTGDQPVTLILAPFLTAPAILQKYIVRLLITRVKKDLRRIHLGHIEAIIRLAQGRTQGTRLHLPNGLLVKRSYEKLLFLNRPEPEPALFSFWIPGPGRFEFKQIDRVFTLSEHDTADQKPDESAQTAWLDADKITYPLLIRNFRPGDRFMPLGMSSEKKLKDFFIDQKIPRELRHTIPIILCGRDIIWIGACRIDDRYKVTEQTRRVLRIDVSGL
jgi:tRNA(Ile)-lysidine synthase